MRTSTLAISVALFAWTCGSQADEVKYVEKDGIMYRETRQVMRCPVTETRMQTQECTVYKEKITTEIKQVQRSYQVPVTAYQWAPQWERGWNPFAAPYLTYKLVPQTRWETKNETVRIPVTNRELVPEKRTVQVPVTSQRFAENEVISRVAVGVRPGLGPTGTAPAPTTGDPFASGVASRETLGGVTKLDSDPPREAAGWKAADPGVRR